MHDDACLSAAQVAAQVLRPRSAPCPKVGVCQSQSQGKQQWGPRSTRCQGNPLRRTLYFQPPEMKLLVSGTKQEPPTSPRPPERAQRPCVPQLPWKRSRAGTTRLEAGLSMQALASQDSPSTRQEMKLSTFSEEILVRVQITLRQLAGACSGSVIQRTNCIGDAVTSRVTGPA